MDHVSLPLLCGLADKYRRLLLLRLEQAEQAPRAELRALATRFPGALRELDQLPLELIRGRLQALETTLALGAEPELWMTLQASYHGMMRASLRIRRWSRHWPAEAEAAARSLAERYVPEEDEPGVEFFDANVLGTIRKPPHGRLNPIVLAAVARLHAVEPEQVQKALFLR